MIIRLLCFIIAILLTGCVEYVYVPKWVCPNSPIPEKKELLTRYLSEQTNTDEILRAMASDLVYLEGYNLQVIKLLESYNTKAIEATKQNKELPPR